MSCVNDSTCVLKFGARTCAKRHRRLNCGGEISEVATDTLVSDVGTSPRPFRVVIAAVSLAAVHPKHFAEILEMAAKKI